MVGKLTIISLFPGSEIHKITITLKKFDSINNKFINNIIIIIFRNI